jgi:hypothetical protein
LAERQHCHALHGATFPDIVPIHLTHERAKYPGMKMNERQTNKNNKTVTTTKIRRTKYWVFFEMVRDTLGSITTISASEPTAIRP